MKHTVPVILKHLYWGISCGCTLFVLECLVKFLLGGAAGLASVTDDFVRQVAGYILVGVACVSTTAVYHLRRLSFRRKVILHFAIGLGVLYSVSLYLGWLPVHPGQAVYSLFQALIQLGVFVAIWLACYLLNRHEARQINVRLRQLEQERAQEQQK